MFFYILLCIFLSTKIKVNIEEEREEVEVKENFPQQQQLQNVSIYFEDDYPVVINSTRTVKEALKKIKQKYNKSGFITQGGVKLDENIILKDVKSKERFKFHGK